MAQVVVVLVVAGLLGVGLTLNPLKLLGAVLAVVLGAVFFSCLSMTIAGLVMKRDRLMGIALDFLVLLVAAVVGVLAASSLLGRLAR